MTGSIVSIQLCVGHRDPMKSVETAFIRTGYGIEGDRHAVSEGVRTKRQVLLIDQETLDKFELSPGEVRENITTSGIDLHSLSEGQRLALGDDAVVRDHRSLRTVLAHGRDSRRVQHRTRGSSRYAGVCGTGRANRVGTRGRGV